MTENIKSLVDWATASGAYLHPDVEIYKDAVTGLSFKAQQTIAPQTSIVRCSYQISLSYLNAIGTYSEFPSTDPFPVEFLENLKQDDPNIIGHFFLIQQYLKGDQSPWWQYIRLLPQPNDPKSLGIPIWWPEEDQEFLTGTNAEPPLQKREQMWRDHYILYRWAATIFDSRSFRPSLTVCPEALSQSSTDTDLNLDHIRNDRFSILYPLVDIGNHNGINQVEWRKDPISNSFDLVHSAGVSQGDQIYNYYGNKSNSELLVGYGFILPNDLRSELSQSSRSKAARGGIHVLPCKPPSANGSHDSRILEFHSFGEGLVDLICCIVANERERSYMLKFPEICPERIAQPFQSPLCRAVLQAILIIQSKLAYEIEKIEQIGASLGPPQNYNQSLALNYRNLQLITLRSALQPLDLLTTPILTPSLELSPHSSTGTLKILSIEQAYSLLTHHYPSLSTSIHNLIASDQEEELPLDWSVLLEDWNFTYWTLWVYIIMLKRSDQKTLAAIHPALEKWIRDGTLIFSPQNPTPTFHGAIDEHETLTTTLSQLRKLHPELFNLQNVNHEHLLSLASCVVKEQTFTAPVCSRRDSSNDKGLVGLEMNEVNPKYHKSDELQSKLKSPLLM
ncbi:uncharacterized protein EAF02_003202 [Botrytis sinoallii]|uniref:uncharacterized protein n=1 Tax=Botrytis sinoallii TaxID=1463999 RepID=UPI001902A46B|nr:uncharacterized protein EAF02_003202 [Botrytis sinoallii]KAF7888661.1 hypothetical protein EAF02_003202 [Botrytis sinoallii]